jgi:hypothetical protein
MCLTEHGISCNPPADHLKFDGVSASAPESQPVAQGSLIGPRISRGLIKSLDKRFTPHKALFHLLL